MIKFCSLYSGSSGNCYYVNVDGKKIYGLDFDSLADLI